MADLLAGATIFEKEGDFFYSLDGGETDHGPFQTQEAAAETATAHLTDLFTDLAKQALFGASK